MKIDYTAYIYYIIIIICGQICCMTLFSALFLDYFVKFTQTNFMRKGFTPISAISVYEGINKYLTQIRNLIKFKEKKVLLFISFAFS